MEILESSPKINMESSIMKEKYPALGDYLTNNSKRKYEDGMSTDKISMIEQIIDRKSSSLLSNSQSGVNILPAPLNMQLSSLFP